MAQQDKKITLPRRLLPWWLESALIGVFYVIALKIVPQAWIDDTPKFVAVTVAASVAWFVFVAALNRLAART